MVLRDLSSSEGKVNKLNNDVQCRQLNFECVR